MIKIVYPTKSYFSDFFDGNSFGENTIFEIERYSFAFRKFKQTGLKKLTIGTTMANYPFNFSDTKHFDGYSVEICNALGKYLNIDVEYCGYNGISGMIKALLNKEVNLIIGSISVSAARRLLVDFSIPYYWNESSIIIIPEYKNIKNLQELDQPHMRLAVSYDSVYDTMAQQIFKKAKIQKYYGMGETALSLLVGKADAILDDDIWTKHFEWQHKNKVTMLTTNIKKSFPVSIAVNKGQQILLDVINIFISQYCGSQAEGFNRKRWLTGEVG